MKNYRKEWEEKKPTCPECGGLKNTEYYQENPDCKNCYESENGCEQVNNRCIITAIFYKECGFCDGKGIQPYHQYLEAELEKREAVISNAYDIANNSIYFADGSDYRPAFYDVCSTLKPELEPSEHGKDVLLPEE